MTDRPTFKDHDYFMKDKTEYNSRAVFQEHVRHTNDKTRELRDDTEELQAQTEVLHQEMRDYHGELDAVIEGNLIQTKVDERVEQKYNDLDEEYNTQLNGLTAQFAHTTTDVNERGVNVKSLGVKTDGTDKKNLLQQIINEYDSIYFPDGFYSIQVSNDNQVGLNIPSNKTLVFSDKAYIKLLPHTATHYQVLQLNNVENVKLINPKIYGSREENSATSGEWGHGINMRGATNITIENPIVKDCWGDGIYIGSTAEQNYCEDIFIDRPICDNNRRQGISCISVKNVVLNRPELINTNGTRPEAGMDIEPNNNGEFIQGLRIINPITKGNVGAGIMAYLQNMADSNNDIDILIENHVNEGGDSAAFLLDTARNVKGSINTIRPIWKNSFRNALRVRRWETSAPLIEIYKPNVVNPNTSGGTSTRDNSTFSMFADEEYDGTGLIGNLHIIEPTITGVTAGERLFLFEDFRGHGVENVRFIDPLEVNYNNSLFAFIPEQTKAVISDENNVMVKDVNAASTIGPYNYAPKTISKSYTSSRVTTLPKAIQGYPRIEFESWGGASGGTQFLIIQPNETDRISPIGGFGESIRSGQIGAKITLEKVSENEWFIVEQIGEWTVVQ